MLLKNWLFVVIMLLSYTLQSAVGYWGEETINKWFRRSKKETRSTEPLFSPQSRAVDGDAAATAVLIRSAPLPDKKECDENQILLQLARLYIISPERIVLLLTMHSPSRTCKDISKVLRHINGTFTTCLPLPPDNLYMKLYVALCYFYERTCVTTDKSKVNSINNYHDCFKELREDLIECEGPPDWFEKKNQSCVCQCFTDIIDCDYIKAAMLCGKTAARMLRSLAIDVLEKVAPFKCEVPSCLPHVSNPMPCVADSLHLRSPFWRLLLCNLYIICTSYIY